MAGFCRSCGSPLVEGAAFCGSCGTPVAASAEPAPANSPVAATPAASAPPSPPPTQPPAPPPPASHVPPPAAYAPPPPTGSGSTPWIVVAVLAVLVALAAVWFATRTTGDEASVPDEAADTAAVAGEQQATTETPVGPIVTKYVASTANIRNVPTAQGPDSRVLGSLRAGIQVQGQMVVGPGNAYWLKLSDGRGYVSAVNLSDGPGAVQPLAPQAQGDYRTPVRDGVYCQVAIRSGNLRIRSNPAGRIIGGMPRGSRFQMYGDAVFAAGYYWVQIQPADLRHPTGWVASDHISC